MKFLLPCIGALIVQPVLVMTHLCIFHVPKKDICAKKNNNYNQCKII